MTEVAKEALDLDELKALCAAATEGPWVADVTHEECGGDDPNVPDVYWTAEIAADDESVMYCAMEHDPTGDAEFIAAARTAVPALIAEVERLRAQRDEALAGIDGYPPLESVSICRACLEGIEGECHTPGCVFWMHDAPTGDLAETLRGYRPVEDGTND